MTENRRGKLLIRRVRWHETQRPVEPQEWWVARHVGNLTPTIGYAATFAAALELAATDGNPTQPRADD